ncbi:MAG: DEAD/DEAH box helicase [Candidatus Paralactobacillus gallistercoris]|uniref:DEAD/DEAH box helicase n=1 Tax=Candidatus Paralactobacillus gallistercoris TaxID=2838724 RepID=A0A948X1F7_9LACO|nr:DEAD/DEAH box helicase [Candidatus Paralactobacillus gallistercoris]
MKYSQKFMPLWQANGFHEMTPIQAAVLKPLRHGENIVGLAPTGTGKTLAFALPMLETIMPHAGLQSLILVPSQELALQLRNVIRPWAAAVDLQVQAVTGKANIKRQIERLKKKPEVLVATLGRLLELTQQHKIKYHQLVTIIIDEADDMLQRNRLDKIREVISLAPADVQLALFSATTQPIFKELTKWFGSDFNIIDVRHCKLNHTVTHHFLQVANQHRIDMLRRLSHAKDFRALVFFNHEAQMHQAAVTLRHQQVKFAELSSVGNQLKRQQALRAFREHQISLLLATDLAARGLDINNLENVINFEVPNDQNTYIHRAGRTGRMFNAGRVITLGNDHDLRTLRHLVTDKYAITRIYVNGSQLTTDYNEVMMSSTTNDIPVASDTVKLTKKKHHKKRQRNQKNKGYHPRNKKTD